MKAKTDPADNTDQDLTGVEIFKAGTYQVTNAAGEKQNVVYTADDVKQLAENGNSLLDGSHYEAPAKLGHSENQKISHEAGLPAAGWVTRLYSKGSKLLADFKQVPAKLAEAIRRGRYKYVSSEIYDPEDTERNFGEFGVKGFTLRAVAFLGADVPVVKGLSPLMLAAGADGARVITLEVSMPDNFAEEFGGPGSGDFDHAGRPGMQGGSQSVGSRSYTVRKNEKEHPMGSIRNLDGKKVMVNAHHYNGTHSQVTDTTTGRSRMVETGKLKRFAEGEPDGDEGRVPLMVPANRHPYGALVKNTEDEKDDGPHVVHAVHPDGTYDTHPLHGDGKAKTAVPHDNLTLLSESEYRKIKETTNMDAVKLAEIEKTAAADKAALAAERAENKRLREGQRDAKITAFAEKYKEYGLTAALKPSFEAVAKMDISTPVKLAEGKELPFVDAFLAFAEGVIKQRQMITGELTPATGDEAPKEDAVKLAELPYQAHAAVIHGEVTNGDIAVKARKYAEENNVPYKKALLAVAALSQEVK